MDICATFHIAISCVIISTAFFCSMQTIKTTISFIKRKISFKLLLIKRIALMKIDVLSARTIFSHQCHVNTVREIQVRIYCVLLGYQVAHP